MTGGRYSFIPAASLYDDELTDKALRVLSYLGSHTNEGGWCRVKQKTAAEELGVARSTLQAALKLLYERGWVEKRHEGWKGVEPDPSGYPFAAHSYRVCIEREKPLERSPVDERTTGPDMGEVPGVSGTGGARPGSGTGCPTSSGTYERSTSNEQEESPPVGPPRACGQVGAKPDGRGRGSARRGQERRNAGEDRGVDQARGPPRKRDG